MRRAFTVAEVLKVMVVVALLVALLYPVYERSSRKPYTTFCLGNLKQIGTALQIYVQDYDQRLPPHGYVVGTQSYTLPYLLHPYLRESSLWKCPKIERRADQNELFDGTLAKTGADYGYNGSALEQNGVGANYSSVRNSAATVAFVDSSSYLVAPQPLVPVLGGTAPVYRHYERSNVGWLDGHVKSMSARELEDAPEVEDGKTLGSGIDAYRYWNRW